MAARSKSDVRGPALRLVDSIVAGYLNGESRAGLRGAAAEQGVRLPALLGSRIPRLGVSAATMLADSAAAVDQENQENVPPGVKGAAHATAALGRTALGPLRANQYRPVQPQVRLSLFLAAVCLVRHLRARILVFPVPVFLREVGKEFAPYCKVWRGAAEPSRLPLHQH